MSGFLDFRTTLCGHAVRSQENFKTLIRANLGPHGPRTIILSNRFVSNSTGKNPSSHPTIIYNSNPDLTKSTPLCDLFECDHTGLSIHNRPSTYLNELRCEALDPVYRDIKKGLCRGAAVPTVLVCAPTFVYIKAHFTPSLQHITKRALHPKLSQHYKTNVLVRRKSYQGEVGGS